MYIEQNADSVASSPERMPILELIENLPSISQEHCDGKGCKLAWVLHTCTLPNFKPSVHQICSNFGS